MSRRPHNRPRIILLRQAHEFVEVGSGKRIAPALEVYEVDRVHSIRPQCSKHLLHHRSRHVVRRILKGFARRSWNALRARQVTQVRGLHVKNLHCSWLQIVSASAAAHGALVTQVGEWFLAFTKTVSNSL